MESVARTGEEKDMNNRDWRAEAKKAFKERDEAKRKLEETENALETLGNKKILTLATLVELAAKFPSNGEVTYDLAIAFKELAEAFDKYSNLKTHRLNGVVDYAIENFKKHIGVPLMKGVMSGLHLGQCFKMKEKIEVTEGFEYYGEALDTVAFSLNELERISPEAKGNDLWKNLMYERGDTFELLGENERSKGCFLELYQVDKSFKDVAKRIGIEEK